MKLEAECRTCGKTFTGNWPTYSEFCSVACGFVHYNMSGPLKHDRIHKDLPGARAVKIRKVSRMTMVKELAHILRRGRVHATDTLSTERALNCLHEGFVDLDFNGFYTLTPKGKEFLKGLAE